MWNEITNEAKKKKSHYEKIINIADNAMVLVSYFEYGKNHGKL